MYVEIRPTKDLRHDIVPKKKFNSQKQNNAIFNIAVDEILLHENKK